MANTRRRLKDYMGFSIVVINGCKYVASKDDAPSVEKHDQCLTFRSNDLRRLKKEIRTYMKTGKIEKEESLEVPDAWIIAVCNTEADGVMIRKAFGDEQKIRKMLVRMVQEDRENDDDAYDNGTEAPDEVQKEWNVLNAYATYYNYHIDYTAMKVSDIKNVANSI